MTWIRFPIVAIMAAALVLAGTVAVAARDGGGPSNKHHGRASHSSTTAGTNDGGTGVAGGAATVAGTSGQAGTGATTSVSTTNSSSTHHGATVTKDLLCAILTPPFGSVFATDSIFVLTPSGHAVLVCKGDLPASVGPTSAIVIDGLVCVGPGVAPTTRSHTTITPSGEVSLTCHFPS